MPKVELWIAKAESDLRSAIKLSKDGDDTLDTAVYHTQQCAEKALKAYLVFKNQKVQRTHDLEKILQACTQFDASFVQLLDEAVDLLPYAVYSRYPDDYFAIDRDEALDAIKKAKNILNFVKKKIKEISAYNRSIF